MKHALSDSMIQEVTGIFAALGDPSRLKILRALLDAKGSMNQGAVAEATGLSQANASKHLACLVRVGLVSREPEGTSVYFEPVQPLVKDLCDLVCDHAAARTRQAYKALG
ncbi:MAG TPA: metalloregulator ArsR/SmtB family transcription factor [Holophagaceae bacterium]|nr:metalloregulator ArsR/SmtB family transcription factor [Holophagaceae bacterium]